MLRRRRSLLICALAILSGCSSWRFGQTSELRTQGEKPRRLLVLTKNSALYLADAYSDDRGVRGDLVRAWTVPEGDLAADGDSLGYLQQSRASPQEIAERLRWQEQLATTLDAPVQVEMADVRFVRVYEPNAGSTTGAVFGGVLGGMALLGLIGFVVVLSTIHTSCGRPL